MADINNGLIAGIPDDGGDCVFNVDGRSRLTGVVHAQNTLRLRVNGQSVIRIGGIAGGGVIVEGVDGQSTVGVFAREEISGQDLNGDSRVSWNIGGARPVFRSVNSGASVRP